ncbi:MAG TPA: hypothetical protein VHU60_02220 [Gaiellaceae bacterium]|nr:hypothetical protein [Gaiellaceae bacterium]
MTRRILGLLGSAAIVAGTAAATASADGLPVLGVDVGSKGVTVPSAAARYVTLWSGPKSTVVARVARNGGRIVRSKLLQGTFTIPAVAYDGSASGLSADGSVLVLIQPRTSFPRARTSFAVLDARHLRLVKVLRLRGDFSFDAISPSGDRIFLIQYLSPRDATKYAVRAYDVRGGRLLPEPVVDPHEADEQMRGQPLSRAMSPDGRWAYTLYDGNGKTPFVHALDTSHATARCIDLDALRGEKYLWGRRLDVRSGGEHLVVRNGSVPELIVNTKTFDVSKAPVLSAAPAAREGSSLTSPWALAGLGLALAAVAGGVVLIVRRSLGDRPIAGSA